MKELQRPQSLNAGVESAEALTQTPLLIWHNCYDRRWRDLMTPDALVHPAKFSAGLIDRIYTHGLAEGWWMRGDIIGDPFGGVAGGGIYAGYHGLNWIGVELEENFVGLGNANLSLHGPKWMALGGASRVALLQGDSRRFAEIVAADAILTSPPYADGLGHGGGRPIHQPGQPGSVTLQGQKDGYGASAGQIGGLSAGRLDAVLTSPPYAETRMDGGGLNLSNEHGGGSFGTYDKGATDVYRTQRSQQNIGNLGAGSIDGVITSPPFGDEQPCASQRRAKADYHGFTRGDGAKRDQIQRSAGNIAALGASETYWQAMHQVYHQCLLSLRPGGVMAVVVKDFVKSKTRVLLCDQTSRLLAHLGFEPICRIHAMLVKEHRTAGLFHEHVERTERKSFFRRLAEKKGSPRIDYEEVLVVRKAVAS